INFSSYGASFVCIGKNGKPVASLYNYLKAFPVHLQKQFYNKYGGEELFSLQTASPVLGSLNSGLQLYRMKYEKPEIFRNMQYAMHLPQYLSYLITGKCFSDLTSIGCHTALWDFQNSQYHNWVIKENIIEKLPEIKPSSFVVNSTYKDEKYITGIGFHDSSAALIPYLKSFQDPFVLISTGTWCISLNPFNNSPLTYSELKNDCLCYLTYEGKPVKSSRLFAGQEHEEQTARIAEHFGLKNNWYQSVKFNNEIIHRLHGKEELINYVERNSLKHSVFSKRDLNKYSSPDEAYHQLMIDIVREQFISTQLVIQGTSVKRIFVDGGFSRNAIYMNLLAAAFPDMEVYAAFVSQATALGTALAIHSHWNNKHVPNSIIELKYYSLSHDPIV
ncbi:MAG: FGGY-family carbohydrate kinase, partial [Flavisolibacter sp.]